MPPANRPLSFLPKHGLGAAFPSHEPRPSRTKPCLYLALSLRKDTPATLSRIRNALREQISRNADGLTAEHENGSGRAMFLREGALASIVFWLRGDRLRRRRLQVRPRDELDAIGQSSGAGTCPRSGYPRLFCS